MPRSRRGGRLQLTSSPFETPIFRFAPSPNGELHLGHALSAIIGFEWAQRLGGRFLLRIEDIDVGRCRPEFEEAIYRDLSWLGIVWEQPVLRQSQRFPAYIEAESRLNELGVLYPCFATRSEIAAAANPEQRDPDGALIYPGLHKGLPRDEVSRRIAAGEPFALRIDMAKAIVLADQRLAGGQLAYEAMDARGNVTKQAVDPARWGDAVIVRKDIPASYHLAVVVDDAHQGVTHVTRGLDLLAATDLQRLIQVLLDLPAPLYHHHRLVVDSEGRKLSKSARDTGLAALRKAGWTPADVRAQLMLD